MTPGQKWKRKRALVIHVAAHAGFSQRDLADVFDLPRSRVATILKETAALEAEWRAGSGHPENDATPVGPFPFPRPRRKQTAHARGERG